MKVNKFEWAAILVFTALVAMFLFTGCKSDTDKASKLNEGIQSDTQQVIQDAGDADRAISSADQKVVAASTQPANPPETTALLNGAHSDLGEAHKDLAPIAPAAVDIQKKSNQAQAVTDGVQKKLDAERDHWLGYKTRVALWIGIPIVVVVAIATFLLNLDGAAPLLAMLATVVGFLGSIFNNVGTVVFHVVTLGAAKLAGLVNGKKATTAAPAAPHTPTAPAS